MIRPIVIVDPLSSGIELAPAFKARGIPVIAVVFKPLERVGFGTQIQNSDFIQIIPDGPNLAATLEKYNPLAIIPRTESGVALAQALSDKLTPHFSNDPDTKLNRLHKAYMQKALEEAGIPSIKTLNASSELEIEAWIKNHNLSDTPLIIKPPISAGSDKVFHIPAKGEWKKSFNRVLTEPSKITGEVSKTVVVQVEAIGDEYAIGTVSANGKHYVAHIIKYNKSSSDERKTIFDYVEFIPYEEKWMRGLFVYTKQALDALGIKWGAARNEVIMTKNGPRLVETGARMCGGPVVGFARTATGSSQADKLVEAYIDGDVNTKEYQFIKTVMTVFLKSPAKGIISNVEALEGISQLPTLLNKYIWFKNGDLVPHTVDYLTSIGIIALSGDRESILLDYKKIRHLESKLLINFQ